LHPLKLIFDHQNHIFKSYFLVEIVGNTGAIAESTSRGSLTKLHWCWQSSEKGS